MKVFAGSYVVAKSGLLGLLVGGALVAADALLGLEWMPNRTMSAAFAGIILVEWISRLARRAYEGWHGRHGFWSTLLQAFIENISVTIFYILVATAAHLFALMFAHRGDFLTGAAQMVKGASFFALALMSLTFIVVNLRGERGAKLFFARAAMLWKRPQENIDVFVDDPEDRQ